MANKHNRDDGMRVDVNDEEKMTIKKARTEFHYLDQPSSAAALSPLGTESNASGRNDAPPRPDKSGPRTMEDTFANTEEPNASGSGRDKGTFDSWGSFFCSLPGNEFFYIVDQDYVVDSSNLTGLSSQIPYYDIALKYLMDATLWDELAKDLATTQGVNQPEELIKKAARMLYGMIHARFILSGKGMHAMALKYKHGVFWRCPRFHCTRQPCLLISLMDIPNTSTVKLYCPKCEDVYHPESQYKDIDGAYFGTLCSSPLDVFPTPETGKVTTEI